MDLELKDKVVMIAAASRGRHLHRDLGPVDYGPEAQARWTDLITRWYDWQFKEIDNGYAEEPPVRLFIVNENRWRLEHEWPLARAEHTDFFLHSEGAANTPAGDGSLSMDEPGGETPDGYAYDPRDPVSRIMLSLEEA